MKKATFCALSLVALLVMSSTYAEAGVRATGTQSPVVRHSAPREQAVAGTWSWIADLIRGWLEQRSK